MIFSFFSLFFSFFLSRGSRPGGAVDKVGAQFDRAAGQERVVGLDAPTDRIGCLQDHHGAAVRLQVRRASQARHAGADDDHGSLLCLRLGLRHGGESGGERTFFAQRMTSGKEDDEETAATKKRRNKKKQEEEEEEEEEERRKKNKKEKEKGKRKGKN